MLSTARIRVWLITKALTSALIIKLMYMINTAFPILQVLVKSRSRIPPIVWRLLIFTASLRLRKKLRESTIWTVSSASRQLVSEKKQLGFIYWRTTYKSQGKLFFNVGGTLHFFYMTEQCGIWTFLELPSVTIPLIMNDLTSIVTYLDDLLSVKELHEKIKRESEPRPPSPGQQFPFDLVQTSRATLPKKRKSSLTLTYHWFIIMIFSKSYSLRVYYNA